MESLQKVINLEDFSSSIIPIMTSSNKATNKYGEWTISSSDANAWKLFDNTHDTAVSIGKSATITITISLPEGASMKVTKVAQQKKANPYTYFTFYGVTEEGTREQLSYKCHSSSYSQYSTSDVNIDKFYSKFVLTVRNGAYSTTSAASGFWVLAGTIRY